MVEKRQYELHEKLMLEVPKTFIGRMVEKRQRELHKKLMPAVIEAGKNFIGRMVEKRQRELHKKLMPAVIEASKNFKVYARRAEGLNSEMDEIRNELWFLVELEENGLLTDANILERNDLENQLKRLKSMKLYHVGSAAESKARQHYHYV